MSSIKHRKSEDVKTDIFGYRWASININGKTYKIRLRKKSEWEKELENGLRSMSW